MLKKALEFRVEDKQWVDLSSIRRRSLAGSTRYQSRKSIFFAVSCMLVVLMLTLSSFTWVSNNLV